MNCTETTDHELNRINQLKIDWDFKVRPSLRRAYVDSIIRVCGSQGIRVNRIRANRSEHGGQHYRVDIEPSINPELAVEIQAVLADDPMRVGFCKARIKSRLDQWNILHEVVGIKIRTIYSCARKSRQDIDGDEQLSNHHRWSSTYVALKTRQQCNFRNSE